MNCPCQRTVAPFLANFCWLSVFWEKIITSFWWRIACRFYPLKPHIKQNTLTCSSGDLSPSREKSGWSIWTQLPLLRPKRMHILHIFAGKLFSVHSNKNIRFQEEKNINFQTLTSKNLASKGKNW